MATCIEPSRHTSRCIATGGRPPIACYIHPNTLDHRLRRARELNGLNLDDPEDLATMVLALRDVDARRAERVASVRHDPPR